MATELSALLGSTLPAPHGPVRIPVEYDRALQALVACTKIDEAKYWDSKADALAAWAKIYNSPQAETLARRLKLHAYRRMGELAEALRPGMVKKSQNSGAGRLPGPISLLREHGLTRTAAAAARNLALLSERQFEKTLQDPVSPATTVHKHWWRKAPLWQQMHRSGGSLRAHLVEHPPKEIFDDLDAHGNIDERWSLEHKYNLTRVLIDELRKLFDALDKELTRREKLPMPPPPRKRGNLR